MACAFVFGEYGGLQPVARAPTVASPPAPKTLPTPEQRLRALVPALDRCYALQERLSGAQTHPPWTAPCDRDRPFRTALLQEVLLALRLAVHLCRTASELARTPPAQLAAVLGHWAAQQLEGHNDAWTVFNQVATINAFRDLPRAALSKRRRIALDALATPPSPLGPAVALGAKRFYELADRVSLASVGVAYEGGNGEASPTPLYAGVGAPLDPIQVLWNFVFDLTASVRERRITRAVARLHALPRGARLRLGEQRFARLRGRELTDEERASMILRTGARDRAVDEPTFELLDQLAQSWVEEEAAADRSALKAGWPAHLPEDVWKPLLEPDHTALQALPPPNHTWIEFLVDQWYQSQQWCEAARLLQRADDPVADTRAFARWALHANQAALWDKQHSGYERVVSHQWLELFDANYDTARARQLQPAPLPVLRGVARPLKPLPKRAPAPIRIL